MNEKEPIWAKEFSREIFRLVRDRGEDMPLIFLLPNGEHMVLKDIRNIGDEIFVDIGSNQSDCCADDPAIDIARYHAESILSDIHLQSNETVL